MGLKSNNKRIAKNTLIVYIRLFIVTVVGLLTSRFVLQALGISDYGLYHVVGGVIALFSVIAGSMSSTTIRFLNIEIGKEAGNPNKIFNICQITHIAFAIIVFLLAETIGIIYILNYLNVAPGKEADAMFVFQVSTIVACVGIINVPYQSVFVAKEKFFHIAVIDTVNALIKLGLILLLLLHKGNALRLYAIFMSATTFVSFVVYHYLCFRYWPKLVKWKFSNKLHDYKELLVYNNYVLLSAVAYLCRSQGTNLLINYFFGTVVNGAYGIARTVETFVMTFTVNFDSAAAPQITQNVGSGNLAEAYALASRSCRICQLLSLLVVFPLFVEMEFVLKLWLGTVPEYTASFCRVILLSVFVASTGGGFLRLKDALGKLKWFMLSYSFFFIISLPIGYVLLKLGYPAVTILILCIIIDIICRVCQLALMKIIYNYNILTFCKEAYTKPMLIVSLMTIYSFGYENMNIINSNWEHVASLILTGFMGATLIWLFGITNSERKVFIKYLLKTIKKNCTH